MAGKLDATEKMALEAMQSTKAAYKRLDKLTKELADLTKRVEDIKKEIEKRIDADKDRSMWYYMVLLERIG
ncbi:UNVERIFIED_CONTAM: chromosome segregation ATPase [Brevibacillus sp. OAP136]